MPPVEVIAITNFVTRCMRKYMWSHRSRKCIWSHQSRKCIWSHRFGRKNLIEIGQVLPEILKILVNPRWRLCRHLDLVQRLKLIGNISVASMRRPAKFGRNRSSRAGDIKDFSKSKIATVPPFWM